MTAAALGEIVSGRTIPRYRGEPIAHEIRWYGTDAGHPFYPGGLIAACEPCGWSTAAEPGHTTADLDRLARQHAGIEDEDP